MCAELRGITSGGPHGTYAWGRWVGMSYDGEVVTGWGAIARTDDEAHCVVKDLTSSEKP